MTLVIGSPRSPAGRLRSEQAVPTQRINGVELFYDERGQGQQQEDDRDQRRRQQGRRH